MGRDWKCVGAWLAIAAMLCVAGCSSATDKSAEATPAEIKGNASSAKGPGAPGTGQSKTARPTVDTQHPVVKIETSLGDITVRLDREKAQLTVDNFLSLVERSFYDQTIFHQVLKKYVVLGGGYTIVGSGSAAQLTEKPAITKVRNEARNGRKNLRGTIAMARLPHIVDSATSQFFINLADNPQLDHKPTKQGLDGPPEDYGYCVFGDVIEGMDVVEKISNVPVQDKGDFERIPIQTVTIKTVRRIQ